VPFEDSHAPKLDDAPHYAQFGRESARYIAGRTRRPFTLLNNRYVWPRLGMSLVSSRFAETRKWLPAGFLYLSQLEQAQTLASRIGQ
jgi:hypothetical protein